MMPDNENQMDFSNPVSSDLQNQLEEANCEGSPKGAQENAVAAEQECKWKGSCYYCKGPDGKWYLQYCI